MTICADGNGNLCPERVNYDRLQKLRAIVENKVRVEFDDGPGSGVGDLSVSENCPKCGYNYTHLEHVTFLADYDLRRESVELKFKGECGHVWRVIFAQHKGITYVQRPPVLIPIKCDCE
jgi:hypothetical protein